MDRLGSFPVPSDDVDVIMKKSQTRMWKTLQGEPQFIISVAETQNTLDKLANSKTKLCYFKCGSCSIDKVIYDTPFRQTHNTNSIL